MKEKKPEVTPTKTLDKKKSTKREKYIDQLTQQLKDWDKELEEFEEKNEKRLSELGQDLNKQVEKLKTKRDELRSKLDKFEDVSEEAYKKVKGDAEKLWNDIKKEFKTARKEMKR